MTSHQILTHEEFDGLTEEMASDSHSCFLPTHILKDDQGRTAGAFSTACAPVLFFWVHSSRHNAVAAAHAYALAEQEFRRLGHDRILLHLESSSPFYPYLVKVGYESLGDMTLFTKSLQS